MNYQVQLNVFIDKQHYSVISVEVTESWEATAASAVITLPKKVRVQTRSGVQSVNTSTYFKKLNQVEIYVGYNAKTWQVFTGFVDTIKPGGESIDIICRDEAICLELFTVKKGWSTVTLSSIVAEIKKQAGNNWYFKNVIQHVDFAFEKYTIQSARAHKVFDNFREYGVDTWVRNGVLHIGLQVVPELQSVHTVDYGIHITSDGNLVYEDKNIDIYVKATSNTGGKRLTAERGIMGGKEIKINVANLSQNQLDRLAQSTLERNPAAGYTGSFDMFGFPHIRHGDLIQFTDPSITTQDKAYYIVKSRKINCSTDTGLRQTIELQGKKI